LRAALGAAVIINLVEVARKCSRGFHRGTLYVGRSRSAFPGLISVLGARRNRFGDDNEALAGEGVHVGLRAIALAAGNGSDPSWRYRPREHRLVGRFAEPRMSYLRLARRDLAVRVDA
jgi:hypothetical protein